MHWNVIDSDASSQHLTRFRHPDFLEKVSLSHRNNHLLEKEDVIERENNYLLTSQDGAITLWHTDFSGTSVAYFLLKGNVRIVFKIEQ